MWIHFLRSSRGAPKYVGFFLDCALTNSAQMNSKGVGRAMFCVFITLKRASQFRLHVTDKVQLKLSAVWRSHYFSLSLSFFLSLSLSLSLCLSFSLSVSTETRQWGWVVTRFLEGLHGTVK